MKTMLTMSILVLALSNTTAIAQSSSAREDETKAAQPETSPPAQAGAPRKTRPVRKSVIDLKAQAKERRPGQILPGDPSPTGLRTPGAASSTPELIPLPNSTPEGQPDAAAASAATSAAPTTPPSAVSGIASSTPGAVDAPAPAAASTREISSSSASEQTPAIASVAATMPTPEPTAPAGVPAPVAELPAAAPVLLVEGRVIPLTSEPASTSPLKIEIVEITGGNVVQWRAAGESWRTPSVNEILDARVEVRCGLEGDVLLLVDGKTQVRISRLGRATIERAIEPGGGESVMITLSRGAVEIVPGAGTAEAGASESSSRTIAARVRTPDQSFGVLGPIRAEYDAFGGTRRRALNP